LGYGSILCEDLSKQLHTGFIPPNGNNNKNTNTRRKEGAVQVLKIKADVGT